MGTGLRAGPRVYPSTCFSARRPLKLYSQAPGVGRSLLPTISSLPLSGRRGKILSLRRRHPLLPTWHLPALEEPDESAVCVPPPHNPVPPSPAPAWLGRCEGSDFTACQLRPKNTQNSEMLGQGEERAGTKDGVGGVHR